MDLHFSTVHRGRYGVAQSLRSAFHFPLPIGAHGFSRSQTLHCDRFFLTSSPSSVSRGLCTHADSGGSRPCGKFRNPYCGLSCINACRPECRSSACSPPLRLKGAIAKSRTGGFKQPTRYWRQWFVTCRANSIFPPTITPSPTLTRWTGYRHRHCARVATGVCGEALICGLKVRSRHCPSSGVTSAGSSEPSKKTIRTPRNVHLRPRAGQIAADSAWNL
jgi:hypothetical protein